jgi:hypothetical protein
VNLVATISFRRCLLLRVSLQIHTGVDGGWPERPETKDHLEADSNVATFIRKSLVMRYNSDPNWQDKETAPILMRKKHEGKSRK